MNSSKTTWDKIVSGKELISAKSLRAKAYYCRGNSGCTKKVSLFYSVWEKEYDCR